MMLKQYLKKRKIHYKHKKQFNIHLVKNNLNKKKIQI